MQIEKAYMQRKEQIGPKKEKKTNLLKLRS